ncbi:V-type ATP synthase subunit A [Microbacterium sp. X-17]|uniref:V-type ATP synthase subunit A n=1 Tax=Microbacterium sp. X-17 TaxID=3144404 RepID=UPI0031F51E30
MSGAITRVNGPVVEAHRLPGLAMGEVVALGAARITAETIAIDGESAVLQAYEYTGGVAVGDTADPQAEPLSGLLGPGLLANAYDGLLRPLSGAPQWLRPDRPGSTQDPSILDRRWRFVPSAIAGATVVAGDLLGTVPDSGAVEHRVLVPPGVSGVLEWIAAEGETPARDAVARIAGREVRLAEPWPLREPRPFAERLPDVVPLHTGQRVLDLLFPVAAGTAAAVPGGFGTGKTVALQQIAKWSDASVIVYVGCGERGNEMADVLSGLAGLTDRHGSRLIDRTVIVANTSNMPMMAREASIYTGLVIAEYYRDMGYDVIVIADSTSRWAESLREFANRNGDLPAEEGYPASLASALAAFYARAARVRTLGGRTAAVTVIGAVSPPGGDMSEPVTTNTERFVRALWSLDRDLAYARHYPAVSWRGSFARDVDEIGRWHAANDDPRWSERRTRALGVLAEADRLAGLAEVIGASALPGRERMTLLGGRLLREGVLTQSALEANDASSSSAKSAALLGFALDTIDECQRLVAAGVAATTLEQWDFSPLLRARNEFAPDDAAGLDARRDAFLAELRQAS